ncbi:RGG repeats nuclear RNA binding protein A-like isoform X2 [Euphorbia lathyris]|uniref:RGG repeats nuclear RNA binding protein A-like isoform X2 n=1 Tax=Euphorbia lathyris TaxID=212925 RepID=UPI0033138C4F
MATMNPFDLLGDDDAEDPSLLIAAHQQKVGAAVPKEAQSQPLGKKAPQTQPQVKQIANLPSKPLPPAQAVKESKSEFGRGGGRGGDGRGRGFGHGRGRGGYNRDYNNENSFNNTGAPTAQGGPEDGDSGRASERRTYGGPRGGGGFRGGRRGGFSNGEDGDEERPRRRYERHSGTGRGATEEAVNGGEKNLVDEKPVGEETADVIKESPTNEPEEKEPEDKEMTLEEYEKVLEEKRKALQALKTEERKVDTRAFEAMQPLSSKKGGDEVFIKLGSDKDKRKEALEKEEKAKKSVSINEFLKPVEGEKYYGSGRGRGSRGRGPQGGYGGRDPRSNAPAAPSIESAEHFPTLGGK